MLETGNKKSLPSGLHHFQPVSLLQTGENTVDMMTWLCFALLLLFIPSVGAMELPGLPQFIDEMVIKHQFKRDELEQIFQRAQYRQAVINLISAPATIKPWSQYRAAFTNNKHISNGLKFWQNHISAMQPAEKEYVVPPEIIVPGIVVKTNHGHNH